MRLSIDITPEQHRVLKAAAALEGLSIKSYVLDRVLPERTAEDQAALADLEAELEQRVAAANRGEVATRSVSAIFDDTMSELKRPG